jgi:hypothetical protein
MMQSVFADTNPHSFTTDSNNVSGLLMLQPCEYEISADPDSFDPFILSTPSFYRRLGCIEQAAGTEPFLVTRWLLTPGTGQDL